MVEVVVADVAELTTAVTVDAVSGPSAVLVFVSKIRAICYYRFKVPVNSSANYLLLLSFRCSWHLPPFSDDQLLFARHQKAL